MSIINMIQHMNMVKKLLLMETIYMYKCNV